MADLRDIRETVRDRYAELARDAALWGRGLYDEDSAKHVPEAAVSASLGCGVPTAVTDEMLELARANAAEAGVDNVEFVTGYLEDMPLDDASVDVVISNCVINLSGDKPQVLREAARVLRPGGRFAVSDVIADPEMDDATKADMAAWTGCIAGALTEDEFRRQLETSGFEQIEVQPTHRVHEHASAAIIRARKPRP